jgi:hypothetical protein
LKFIDIVANTNLGLGFKGELLIDGKSGMSTEKPQIEFPG